MKRSHLTPEEANRLIAAAGQSPAQLRQRSLVLLAHARQVRKDAAAARLRSIELRTKARAAGISASAHQTASEAATRRNDKRAGRDTA